MSQQHASTSCCSMGGSNICAASIIVIITWSLSRLPEDHVDCNRNGKNREAPHWKTHSPGHIYRRLCQGCLGPPPEKSQEQEDENVNESTMVDFYATDKTGLMSPSSRALRSRLYHRWYRLLVLVAEDKEEHWL